MRNGVTSAKYLAVGLSVALALTGCTKSDPKAEQVKAKTEPASQISTTPLPKEGTFKGKWDGAAADVTTLECGLGAGEQVFKGKVKNSSKAARDYQIMVMWLKKDDGKPYGAGIVTIKQLAPGAEKPLEIKANVATQTDKCALNVKAGALK